MSKIKLIGIVIAMLLLAGGGVWGFRNYGGFDSSEFGSLNLAGLFGGQSSPTPLEGDLITGQVSGYQRYMNEVYGFSLDYPEGFSASEFEEGAGTMILFSSPQGQGFQIYITAFDEAGPLTVERIRQDLPKIVIENPQNVILTPSGSEGEGSRDSSPSAQNDGGVRALIFFSRDESLGRTREVWFVWPEDPYPNGNYLYQVTSSAEFDGELSKIMATWAFP